MQNILEFEDCNIRFWSSFHRVFLISQAKSTGDNWKAWLFGPGWFPGLPRLGDNNFVAEKPDRKIHFSKVSTLNIVNTLILLITVVIIHDDITREFSSYNIFDLSCQTIFVFWTAYSIGLQLDEDPRSFAIEFAR